MLPYKTHKPRVVVIDPEHSEADKIERELRDRSAFVKESSPATLDGQGIETGEKFIIYPDGPRVVVEREAYAALPDGSREYVTETIMLDNHTWPAFREAMMRAVKKLNWYFQE